jgi:hypothetical protein
MFVASRAGDARETGHQLGRGEIIERAVSQQTVLERTLLGVAVVVAAVLPAVSASAAADTTGAAAPERKPSWLGVRLAGEVGFGQVTLAAVPSLGETGARDAALAIGFGFEGEGWLRRQLGLGVRVTRGAYIPFATTPLENSYTLIEPQLLWRTVPLLFGPRGLLAASWRAGGGLGLSSVNTDDPCGRRCDHVYAHSNRLSGSVSTGGVLSVGPAAIYAGLRLAFDTAVDWSTVLNVGLGVEF